MHRVIRSLLLPIRQSVLWINLNRDNTEYIILLCNLAYEPGVEKKYAKNNLKTFFSTYLQRLHVLTHCNKTLETIVYLSYDLNACVFYRLRAQLKCNVKVYVQRRID